MEPAVLALLIPVIALATRFVHALKRPSASYSRRQPALEPASEALAEEVATLRQELAETRERLDFMERLLMPPQEPARPGLPGT